MPTVAARRPRSRPHVLHFGPQHNGIILTPAEFDRADWEDGWRYELVNGVLIVSPIPGLPERDPNEELGHWLRSYQETHPDGKHLDFTINEHTLYLGANRRRADRAIWTGLGRKPRPRELPSMAIEFVPNRLRDRIRDYEIKRDEYLAAGIAAYLVIDRFAGTLTEFTLHRGAIKTRTLRKGQVYKTRLLPGFELDFGRLIDLANAWTGEEENA